MSTEAGDLKALAARVARLEAWREAERFSERPKADRFAPPGVAPAGGSRGRTDGERTAQPVVSNRAEVAMVRKLLAVLRDGSLTRQAIKAKLGLPSRARRINDLIRRLEDAGIVGLALGPGIRYGLGRNVEPGELDPPRRELELLSATVEVGAGLEIRAVRFVDSEEVRLQVRRVSRFAGGGVRARHVVGLAPDVARKLGEALVTMAGVDRRERTRRPGGEEKTVGSGRPEPRSVTL